MTLEDQIKAALNPVPTTPPNPANKATAGDRIEATLIKAADIQKANEQK